MTSAEQQELFDDESQKDSAIANYLAVYALLGRGFSLKQPELIVRAQSKLSVLSELQDVGWEQAITALLLGHTEKAIAQLKNSPNTVQLKQVEQHSTDSSDLLPGLCFYGEKWLREEVIAQFSDLRATQLTLKEYFGDRQVQNYLEQLAVPAASVNAKANTSKLQPKPIPQKQTEVAVNGILSMWRNLFSAESTPAKARLAKTASGEVSVGKGKATGTATIERNYPGVSGKPSKSNYRHKASSSDRTKSHPRQPAKSLSLPLEPKTRAVPASVMQKAQGISGKRTRKRKLNKATLLKGWLFILGLVVGTGAVGFTTIKLLLSTDLKTANNAQLAIALDRPAVELPPKKNKTVAANPEPTFVEKSKQTIQTWLDSKSAAFGKEYQIDRLNNILAEPLLSTWRGRAMADKQKNSYREYEHNLTVRSATVDPNDQNKATVEAEVKEIAKHYNSGKLDNTQSYDDNLLVRYQIVRQKDNWVIKDAEVLKKL